MGNARGPAGELHRSWTCTAQSQGALPAAGLERLEGGGRKGVSGAWSFLERSSVFTLQTLRTRSQKVRGFAEGERMEGGIPRAEEGRGQSRWTVTSLAREKEEKSIYWGLSVAWGTGSQSQNAPA